MDWKSNFDERQMREIEFCVMYSEQFGHGTLGHDLRVVVAKMVSILDNAQSLVNDEDEVITLEPGDYVYDDVSLPDGVHLRGAKSTMPDTYITDDSVPGLLACE